MLQPTQNKWSRGFSLELNFEQGCPVTWNVSVLNIYVIIPLEMIFTKHNTLFGNHPVQNLIKVKKLVFRFEILHKMFEGKSTLSNSWQVYCYSYRIILIISYGIRVFNDLLRFIGQYLNSFSVFRKLFWAANYFKILAIWP